MGVSAGRMFRSKSSQLQLVRGQYLGQVECARRFGGIDASITCYESGVALPAHRHERAYLCIVLSGAYEELSGGRAPLRCRAGMVVLHAANCEHADRFGALPARCLNVELDASWSAEPGALPQAIDIARIGAAAARAWARELVAEIRNPDRASRERATAAVRRLITVVADARHRARASDLAYRAMTLLDASDAPDRVDDLAARLGVHPSHLSRRLGAQRGESAGALLRRRRIERACELLAGSDGSISAVAALAGFADQSHLTRSLRAALGLTPSRFRRLHCGRRTNFAAHELFKNSVDHAD